MSYMSNYYKKHPEKVWGKVHPERRREYSRNKLKELTEFVNRIKCQPCKDCGKQYNPWVMDFDHITNDKIMPVSKMVINCSSKERILKEISKCEIVCSNCHRERTHKRKILVGY